LNGGDILDKQKMPIGDTTAGEFCPPHALDWTLERGVALILREKKSLYKSYYDCIG
jgi:hypothetical protein